MTLALMVAVHPDHWFPFFPLIPLFFIGLWICVIARFGRRWRQHAYRSGESILAERYARGEIDEQEYKKRRAALQSKD